MKKIKSITTLATIAGILSFSTSMAAEKAHLRVGGEIGLRKMDQLISNESMGALQRLSIGVVGRNGKSEFGLDLGASNSWAGRFDSNTSTPDSSGLVEVYNSASLDLLAFYGWNWGKCGIEVGAGPQVSWAKWVNSVAEARSKIRIVPKVRIAINHEVVQNTNIFAAASYAFNHYGGLSCPDSTATPSGCFDDDGFVSVADFSIGVNHYF